MGVMDLVRKWSELKKEKSEKYKELEENYKMQKTLEQRQKSSNERELERYFKEKREEKIKEQLKMIHKKQNRDAWTSNSITKSDYNILHDEKKILDDDRPILKEKNIFSSKSSIGGGNMFFK